MADDEFKLSEAARTLHTYYSFFCGVWWTATCLMVCVRAPVARALAVCPCELFFTRLPPPDVHCFTPPRAGIRGCGNVFAFFGLCIGSTRYMYCGCTRARLLCLWYTLSL